MNDVVLICREVSKTYREGKMQTPVLREVNFTLHVGESLAIVGASGSGKSTLLHVLGGLDTADSGQIDIMGQNMQSLGDADRGRLRNQHMGFVYQFHHLMPEFTAVENVAMPLLLRDGSVSDARAAAERMLINVGLEHRLQHKPSELSGGERQRTAIARALVSQPRIVLADEPTGNLDSRSAGLVFDLLREKQREQGTAMVVVTHDRALAGKMGRCLEMIDGRLQDG